MYVRWMGRGLYLIHTIFRDNTLNYTDELGNGTKYDNYDDTRGGEGMLYPRSLSWQTRYY